MVDAERVSTVRADRAVEWLAIMWVVTSPEHNTANPPLLVRLNQITGLFEHPAVRIVGFLREHVSRDELIKLLVFIAYDAVDPDELSEVFVQLDAALADLERRFGAELERLYTDEYQQANAELQPMIEGLDAGTDLSSLVGRPTHATVYARASLFLPAPQAGRHGVLVELAHERIVHMYFGFPLYEPPERYMISRRWVRGGGWHYVVHAYLDEVWPPVAEALAALPELEVEFTRALAGTAGQAWPRAVYNHVELALKCLLDEPRGVPPHYINLLARAHGLSMFEWFVAWIRARLDAGGPLDRHWPTLAADLLADQVSWRAIAEANRGVPRAINLLLISSGRQPPHLVVADDWPAPLIAEIERGWAALCKSALSHRDWLRAADRHTRPVVAFGCVGDNPLVAEIAAEYDVDPAREQIVDPSVVLLSRVPREHWRIAVAVGRPESAAAIKLEVLTTLTCAHAVLSRAALVRTEDLQELLTRPAPHSSRSLPSPDLGPRA